MDAWERRTTKGLEVAMKLKASAERNGNWKMIAESLSVEKRSAERMVFDCVEDLGRAAKRLKGRAENA